MSFQVISTHWSISTGTLHHWTSIVEYRWFPGCFSSQFLRQMILLFIMGFQKTWASTINHPESSLEFLFVSEVVDDFIWFHLFLDDSIVGFRLGISILSMAYLGRIPRPKNVLRPCPRWVPVGSPLGPQTQQQSQRSITPEHQQQLGISWRCPEWFWPSHSGIAVIAFCRGLKWLKKCGNCRNTAGSAPTPITNKHIPHSPTSHWWACMSGVRICSAVKNCKRQWFNFGLTSQVNCIQVLKRKPAKLDSQSHIFRNYV